MNCELGDLTSYVPSVDAPWDRRAVRYLYARLAYKATPQEILSALAAEPVAHVQQRLQSAAALPPIEAPPWADFALSDYENQDEVAEHIVEWIQRTVMDLREHPWRGKLWTFWHSHFATQRDVYVCPSYMVGYTRLIHSFQYGNFREFVRAMGRSEAMLVFLNGVQNTRFEPNENYARELFELFTLGRDRGYTQQDVTEAARALTGYNGFTEACAPIEYLPAAHDPGPKTVFGVTDNFDYDGLIDHLFAVRAEEISTHICRRLYRFFVSTDIDESIIGGLAATLRAANWELLPLYEQLFCSAHFFSPALQATRITDPLDLILGTEHLLGVDLLSTDELRTALAFSAANLGMQLFNPPDVAGWPGGRSWINASLLSARSGVTQQLTFLALQENERALVDWARGLGLSDESDVNLVAREVADAVLPRPVEDEEAYAQFALTLRSEVPSYYFDTGLWNLDFEYASAQLALLLDSLFARPEYQLD